MNPGIYENISNEDYHASAGISRSGIVSFKRSPLHYWNDYLRDNKKVGSTKSMVFGSAFHELILEPEKFNSNYLIVPKINKTTKVGKQKWADIQLTIGDRTALYETTYFELLKMKESVLSNNDAKEIIKDSLYENSIYWADSDTGVLCKARPDIMTKSYIGDLKTTEDASEYAFKYSIYSYNYHIQAAMLIDGYNEIQRLSGSSSNHSNFIMIPVEKKAPYASRVVLMSEEKIQQGREIYKSALIQYKKCLEENNWPTYETITI